MLEYNVDEYLKKNGIKEEDLNELSKKTIALYRKVKSLFEKHPENDLFKANAEKNGKDAIELITSELKDKSNSPDLRKKAGEALSKIRKKSLKQLGKVEKAISSLEECKVRLKEDRKRRLESGEIKPPVKKTRVTKVKESFVRILKLMPSEDQKIIQQSEDILRKCATELFKINGLNKIQVVTEELEEVSDKRTEKLEKSEEKKAA